MKTITDNLSMFSRQSKQRNAIYKTLAGTKTHPDALWVYETVKKTIPNISLGTVYRNLSELAEKGVITEMNVKDNVKNYDADISNHTHFVCDCCGKIYDLPTAPIIGEVADGFKPLRCNVVYYGLCKNCNKSI